MTTSHAIRPNASSQFSSPPAGENFNKNNALRSALAHISSPLTGLICGVIAANPKPLPVGHKPQVPRASISTLDVIEYKLIHYQAALLVVNDLLQQAGNDHSVSFQNLSELIKRSSAPLHEKRSGNPSFDCTSVKQDIGGKYKRGKIKDVFREFTREQKALIQAGQKGIGMPENTRHVHIRTALACVIHGKCRSLGLLSSGHSVEAIDKQIFDRYIDVLQAKEWNNISKRHRLNFSDPKRSRQTIEFITTMTPAKNMDAVLENGYRQDKVNGICSYAIREHRHAVNLWRTEFRPELPDESQIKYAFSGLRHGVHDAYGIKDMATRAAANDARVKELIHASVLEHLMRNHLTPASIDPQKPLRMDIVSVNLLTAVGKEKNMVLQQQSALARANLQEIQLQIADETGKEYTVQVKPRILMFNTPVDYLSLSTVGNIIGIWRTADSINNNAIQILIGSCENSKPLGGLAAARIQSLKSELSSLLVSDVLNANRIVEINQKIWLIQQLVMQIRHVYSDRAHQRVGNEPYKLPTRLLALANEIGATPAFNCKSGKDRTGQLNVEIRDLYAHLNAENGQLRDVNAPRENLAMENYQQLFLTGGDREIQALNTGAPGSKSQLPYYTKLMGVRPSTIDEIKGLSKWVGT